MGKEKLNNINFMIDSISKLENGWLDGFGEKPSKKIVDWARKNSRNFAKIDNIYLYPTFEGEILAEIFSGDCGLSLYIKENAEFCELYDYRLQDEKHYVINLNSVDGWNFLRKLCNVEYSQKNLC